MPAIIVGFFMLFIFGDNIIAPEFTGEPSLTNRAYDKICDGIGGERTASGDCIETK